MTTAPAPVPATAEPTALRALRIVAAVEGVSFVILLVCSALKRTTDFNAVPVMGPIHGVLFLAFVGLVAANWARLGWGRWFALVMLTIGSPGAHFAVHATRIRRV